MEDQDRKASFPLSGILLLLATLGVIAFTQTPLKGMRPGVPQVEEPSEKVKARLWQDPFRAVLDHVKSASTGTSSGAAEDAYEIKFPKEIAKREKVHVLGVMVSGGGYVDDSESRIRTRYAVLAGLRKLGYYPEDPEHIDYARPVYSLKKQVTFSNIMPFEWMKSSHADQNPVLVLWMNDDNYNDKPLEKIIKEMDLLVEKSGRSKIITPIKIIGPAGSTNLIEIVKDTNLKKVARYDTEQKNLSYLQILSPNASVDLARMDEFKNSVKATTDAFTGKYNDRTITFERTIGTDSVLFSKVIDELCLRDVNTYDAECSDLNPYKKSWNAVKAWALRNQQKKPGSRAAAETGKTRSAPDGEREPKDYIVLITEWDTQYGRLLSKTFRHELALKASIADPYDIYWVYQFNYLRGIDGALPGENQKSEKSGTEEEDAKKATEKISQLEQPTGKSQYDYLRRLAEKIRRINENLRHDGKGAVKAVGILGTDYYDKYLVLQALRQELPDAIFFTTDLDARLLQPDHIKWTRNVLVASSFDLELPYLSPPRKSQSTGQTSGAEPAKEKRVPSISGSLPPFRDSYQTSVFLSTLKAFNHEYDGLIKDRMKNPLLFEIGRVTPYPLTRDDRIMSLERRESEVSVDGDRFVHWKFGMAAFVAVGLGAISSNRIRRWFGKTRRVREIWKRAIAPVAVLGLAGFWFYKYVYLSDDQEPFSFFDGISVWPTELIRVAGFVMTVVFLEIARRSLKKNRKVLTKEFALTGSDTDRASGIIHFSWRNVPPWRHREEIDFDCCYRDNPGKNATISELWQQYLCRNSPRYRKQRIVIFWVTYGLFCALVISIFGIPTRPIRGHFSQMVDKLVLIISGSSFLWLTFYVVDATRVFRNFITQASRVKRKWSKTGPAEPDEVEEWRLINLIGKRTEVVGKLIFYPFIVWFVLFVSRIRFFDNWTTPIHWAALVTLSASYAWSCAFILRRSAETARTKALERLSDLIVKERARTKPDDVRIRRIESVKEDVKNTRIGAFAPYMQHPVVQALFVPFGGVGGIAVLDMFTKFNL